MKFGQITGGNISDEAKYLQFDICGLSATDAVEKYKKIKCVNYSIPVILHGDWTKKGFSENNIAERKEDYISIINSLRLYTNVLAITIHPPTRSKMTLETFVEICNEIESRSLTSVFIENRSNKRLLLSNAQEISSFSKHNKMTIDVPQLYISCHYSLEEFDTAMNSIYWGNVCEVHLGNVKRDGPHTYVGRKIDDGEIPYNKICKYFNDVEYGTLEILGGTSVFGSEWPKVFN